MALFNVRARAFIWRAMMLRRADRFDILAVLAIALGAFLRLYHLGVPELEWDEFLALHRALLPFGDMLQSLAFQSASEVYTDTSPPLHHALIHFAALFGQTPCIVRLPSVLFGVLSLWATYLLGKRLMNKEAAFFATLFCAFSHFHIFYSRFMRWYAFFFFFALISLYFYRNIVHRSKKSDVLLYALATAGMLYSSYLAATFLLGQILFTCLFGSSLYFRAKDADRAKSLLVRHLFGLAVVFLLYIPQIQGHLTTYFVFIKSGGHAFSSSELFYLIRQFAVFLRQTRLDYGLLIAGMALIGLGGYLAKGKKSDAAMLLCFCLVPTIAAFLVNVGAQMTAKYLPGLFFLVAFSLGYFFFMASRFAQSALAPFLRPNAAQWLGLTCGAAAVLFTVLPDGSAYSAFYRAYPADYARLARTLILEKQSVDRLMFQSNRGRKVVMNWALGDLYQGFETIDRRDYARFFLLAGKDFRPPLSAVPAFEHKSSGETVRVYRGGVGSKAPIPILPDSGGRFRYDAVFSDFSFYEDVWKADNVGLEMGSGRMALYGFDRNGSATFRLAGVPGAASSSIALELVAVMTGKQRRLVSDAEIRIYAGDSEDGLKLVETISHDSFIKANPVLADPDSSGGFSLNINLSLPRSAPGDGDLFVKFEFVPGRYSTMLEIASLRFEAACAVPEAAPDKSILLLRNLAANATIFKWSQGIAPVNSRALAVFRAQGAPELPNGFPVPVGDERDMAAFRKKRPDLPPVMTLHASDSRPAFYVYDPLMRDAAFTFPRDDGRSLASGAPVPWPVKGLALEGCINNPTIRIGGQQMSIPLAVPQGSRAYLNPGGEGLVVFSPLYTQKSYSIFNMVEKENLSGRLDSLSCAEDRPCSFTYVFASGYPITGFRLVSFPTIKTGGNSRIEGYYSLNGRDAFKRFMSFEEGGAFSWVAAEAGYEAGASFNELAYALFVKIVLSGQDALFLSNEGSPVQFQVRLDARDMAVPEIAAQGLKVYGAENAGAPFSVWLSPTRLPIAQYFSVRLQKP